jgi:DNA polymerase-3 subunit delta
MFIKFNHLTFNISDNKSAIYILSGLELFQLNSLATLIKQRFLKEAGKDVDIKILDGESASDWLIIEREANSYSLFANHRCLDIQVNKRNLNPTAKNFITHHLHNHYPVSFCLIIIKAPNLTLKETQSLAKIPGLQAIYVTPPDELTVKKWLNNELSLITHDYDAKIPDLIYQYNEGNLLACKQVLEKLALFNDSNPLTLAIVESQLNHQREFSLYSLVDACLLSKDLQVVQLLQQAVGSKTDTSLVLWLLTQEIRNLLQLHHAMFIDKTNHKSYSLFQKVANDLKIWPKRLPLYQQALTNYQDNRFLLALLTHCHVLDCAIKTQQLEQSIWHSLENIALSLCTGRQVGYLA